MMSDLPDKVELIRKDTRRTQIFRLFTYDITPYSAESLDLRNLGRSMIKAACSSGNMHV
jgi:hypothetical protein